ncbi:MAG TPA: YoaK family protein [Alphaproteobacteria bacterium]|nr:YoaK family protein [Alphaproteobacteria bacterium]
MLFHDPLSRKLAIGLAVLAGFIDALGYLSLGGIFISFMSGNSTRFAADFSSGADWRAALIPLGIIALFVIGVMAGRAVRHFFPRKPSTAVMVFISLALTSAGLLHGLHSSMLAVLPLAIAMGAANNVSAAERSASA